MREGSYTITDEGQSNISNSKRIILTLKCQEIIFQISFGKLKHISVTEIMSEWMRAYLHTVMQMVYQLLIYFNQSQKVPHNTYNRKWKHLFCGLMHLLKFTCVLTTEINLT